MIQQVRRRNCATIPEIPQMVFAVPAIFWIGSGGKKKRPFAGSDKLGFFGGLAVAVVNSFRWKSTTWKSITSKNYCQRSSSVPDSFFRRLMFLHLRNVQFIFFLRDVSRGYHVTPNHGGRGGTGNDKAVPGIESRKSEITAFAPSNQR